ncbi:large-conductance mechanosensitive channel protein MscL [Desulfocurvibacter africanus]|uniref:large-conductance mechanosensitive channel protein MscL n=1 Tax=Desulfocurvibacter africanus TaxID=873 RepID=UPI00040E9E64|nr:large-conductance mechanosensitive channel protein MscL [Desulfocurvibacter africanus]
MGLIKEFKEFAVKGNMVDLAVGIIIGAAFGRVVTSLVEDVIMPPVGVLVGGVDFSSLSLLLKPAGEGVEAVTLRYGAFIQSVVDFLIVALAVFLLVKGINSMRRKSAAEPPVEPAPTRQEVLLKDIRDLLARRQER